MLPSALVFFSSWQYGFILTLVGDLRVVQLVLWCSSCCVSLAFCATTKSDRLGEDGVSLNKAFMEKLCKRHRLNGWLVLNIHYLKYDDGRL